MALTEFEFFSNYEIQYGKPNILKKNLNDRSEHI